MEYTNGTAEAYRYHTTTYDTNSFVGQTNGYCGPNPAEEFHVSTARRFHPYLDQHAPPVPVSTDGGNFRNGFAPPHQCDHCNSFFDSIHALSEHMQTHHQFFPDTYPPPKADGGSETAEILDLDSHKVHVYQPPGGSGGIGLTPAVAALAPTPPYTPATSVGSNSSSMGWMTPTPPLPALVVPQLPPLIAHEYRPNPFPAYEASANSVKSPAASWKPNPPPPTGGGNQGGGSEARRPKTYNCEACNKWFTSSGHLKRHYNTTLHKNAIKATGGGGGGGGNELNRSTTPSSRSTGTPTGAVNSPAGSDETNKPMEDATLTSPKAIPSPSNGDYRPPSQHQPPPAPLMHSLQPVSPAFQQQHQQQQQANAPMDHYRLPSYPNPGMAGGSGLAPPGQLPYYCPPVHPSYPNNNMYQQQQQQQHVQQHQIYSQSNNIGYPPNSIAPPLSSSVVVVQQLGVGPIASSRGMQQFQQHHVEHQPFNNNNTIEHKINGGEYNDGSDVFMMKSNESDSSGGVGSEGSPADSEDADLLDASDGEEADRMIQLAVPNNNTASFPSAVATTKANGTSKRNGGGIVNTGDTTASFKCTQCDKAFNRVCYLTQHNNTFHKGDKPFKCHMCGKRFPNAELFDQHQQKHAGDKPYKCPLCPKQFNHKTDLRRHMCLHTGQKPFMCQVCSKGFIRKDHMVKHVQTHTRRNALHAHPPQAAAAPSL